MMGRNLTTPSHVNWREVSITLIFPATGNVSVKALFSTSGFLHQPRNPDQNHRANKRDNDGADHTSTRPDS